MGISAAKAELLAIFVETFLYGVYFSLFWVTIVILLQQRRSGQTQYRKLIPVATILLSSATARLVVDFVRIIQGFIDHTDANMYYNILAHPLNVAKTALYISHVTFADCVLIWRCYIICNKRFLVIFPALLMWVIAGASGYYVTWTLTKSASSPAAFLSASGWLTSFCSLTMCTNLYCTSVIVWRIYYTRRATASFQRNLSYVALIIVESGAIYTCSVLACLITYIIGSRGQFVALDSVTPLSGIAFSLVIIQIRFYSNFPQCSTAAGPATDMFKRYSKASSDLEMQNSSKAVPLRSLNILVTQRRDEGYPAESERLGLPSEKQESLDQLQMM
ncbi:hypothetical protein HGRIS_012086 [Hohenbuehelia grisea]|uniref:Uncharacterized protein n=1 Tax=Hohenbuehelia grisea TaxID=104357 RepID=A0ABR3IR78_9AGAR